MLDNPWRPRVVGSGPGSKRGCAAQGMRVTPEMMKMASEMMKNMSAEDFTRMSAMAGAGGAGGPGGAGDPRDPEPRQRCVRSRCHCAIASHPKSLRSWYNVDAQCPERCW